MKNRNLRAQRWVTALAVTPAALLTLAALGTALYRAGSHYRRARQMPVRQETRRRERSAQPPVEAEVPLEARFGTPIQLKADGEGTLFHRRYSVAIRQPTLDAAALMAAMQADPDRFSPGILARFEKTRGTEGQMAVGDEFMIHISGPWNGPVRVIKAEPNEFAFVTLEGHLEAGEIHFRTAPHPMTPDAIRFEIVSWARSSDKLVKLAYETTGLAKAAQTSMWANWCREVVEVSGGSLIGEIEIVTEERPLQEEDEG